MIALCDLGKFMPGSTVFKANGFRTDSLKDFSQTTIVFASTGREVFFAAAIAANLLQDIPEDITSVKAFGDGIVRTKYIKKYLFIKCAAKD